MAETPKSAAEVQLRSEATYRGGENLGRIAANTLQPSDEVTLCRREDLNVSVMGAPSIGKESCLSIEACPATKVDTEGGSPTHQVRQIR